MRSIYITHPVVPGRSQPDPVVIVRQEVGIEVFVLVLIRQRAVIFGILHSFRYPLELAVQLRIGELRLKQGTLE